MPDKEPNDMSSGSGEDRPPEKLTPTDWAILKHVSLYHFTIRHAVQKLFFDSDSSKAGTVLEALCRQGYLKNRQHEKSNGSKETAPEKDSKSDGVFKIGGAKYYLLGGRSNLLASSGLKFPKERLSPPNTEQSFYTHLAALWYCIFDGPRRYRLDQRELTALWSRTIPEGKKIPHQPAFCLANEENTAVVYRLYPTHRTNATQIVNDVRKKLVKDIDNLSLHDWIESGNYGYAIVVPSSDKVRDVRKEISKQRSQDSLLATAPLTVHQAPSPSRLSQALKAKE